MKRLLVIILLIFPLSCYDGLSDMLDDLTMKVPICVDASAAPGGDGRGWRNAFQTLQDAVAAAQPGDEIWVADSLLEVNAQVNVDKSLSIYGGFSGTESRRAERNSNVKTEIKMIVGNNPLFEVSGVIVKIDGFSFTSNTGLEYVYDSIFINNGSTVEISSCTFENINGNNCFPRIINNGSAVIRDCRFNTNRSSNGAAIYSTGIKLLVYDSEFIDNQGTGAGIWAHASEVVIENCRFEGNGSLSTPEGGAIRTVNTDIKIYRSVFISNKAIQGGALYVTGTSSLNIDGCSFHGNETNSSGSGGAIFMHQYNRFIITNSAFSSNSAGNNGGGAIRIFANNTHFMANLTFLFNSASTNLGGAMRLPAGPYTYNIYNSVFQNASNIYLGANTTVNLYNCFYKTSAAGGISGDVNHTANPYDCVRDETHPFISTTPDTSDFLHPKDLIVDKGFKGSYPVGYTVPSSDLAGNTRVRGSAIDIGAYERQ